MDVECIVVGAGVVGLAIGRALARSGREVLVLEGDTGIGQGTSSRNSEVVHAGLYYTPGSMKARLCVAGRERLYAYCDARGVSYDRMGKLIVATSEAELPALDRVAAAAAANGVTLTRLTAQEAQAMEPALHCVAALHSPRTGIVDSHALMLAYQGELEEAGGTVVCRAPVRGGTASGGYTLDVGGADPMTLTCRVLVNAAGLHAPALARTLGLPAPPAFMAKGSYYSLQGRAPFRRLVYPVPEPGGLGVHLTLDMAGQARFGPDVEWVESIDYAVMEPASRADSGVSVRMVPLDAGWSDLGAWDAVWQVGERDGDRLQHAQAALAEDDCHPGRRWRWRWRWHGQRCGTRRRGRAGGAGRGPDRGTRAQLRERGNTDRRRP